MKEYIALDCHKHYSLGERENRETGKCLQTRIEHDPGAIRAYLSGCEPGTDVAIEATGNWYWIVQEIEQAGVHPCLVHPRKAKLMMGMINKTDKLDVHGLNRLQRNGTLPTVWIPPGELRDLRELTRVRMMWVRHRTRLKNRISATLAKYGLQMRDYSDPYGSGARPHLEERVQRLPTQTRWSAQMLLKQLDFMQGQTQELEQRLKDLVQATPQMQQLMTLPGIGVILATVIALEVGDIARFASPQHLASYAGTTPRVHASGGHVRYGPLRVDVNHYLKWAFAEAGNSIALNHRRCPQRHVSQLYQRIKARKGHAKAIGAVARHLAEAAFAVLSKNQPYQERNALQGGSKGGVSAKMS